MRTVTFKQVLYGAARRQGLDPATGDLSHEAAIAIGEFINTRYREAYEHAFWPEVVLVEERQFRPDWDVATAYVIGDQVLYDEKYYTALLASTGETPDDVGSTFWVEAEQLDQYVAWEQAGETKIGAVKAAYMRNPRTNARPFSLSYSPSNNGIQVWDDGVTKPWLELRPQPSTFTAEEWDEETTYAAGETVYSPTTGDCYQATAGNAADDPSINATGDWTLVPFPYVVSDFVKLAAHADLLVEDGQEDRSEKALRKAYAELYRVETIEFEQQNQAEDVLYSSRS